MNCTQKAQDNSIQDFIRDEYNLQKGVSTKTIHNELHAANIYSRAAILKPLVTPCNALKQ